MTPTRPRKVASGDKLHHQLHPALFSLNDPRHRRQRAKHSIVPEDQILDPAELGGKYLFLTQEQFDAEVCDNESALAFAARVGLIQNMRKCPKCIRDMALCKFNNSCGYRWVCRRTEEGRRFTCSVRGMRKDTILDDRLVGILTMLRIMYMFSQNTPAENIITNLDIGHVRSAKTIITRLREMIDCEIKQMDPNMTDKDVETTRQLFLGSEMLDRFGHMLHWGAKYKTDRAGNDTKEDPDQDHDPEHDLESEMNEQGHEHEQENEDYLLREVKEEGVEAEPPQALVEEKGELSDFDFAPQMNEFYNIRTSDIFFEHIKVESEPDSSQTSKSSEEGGQEDMKPLQEGHQPGMENEGYQCLMAQSIPV